MTNNFSPFACCGNSLPPVGNDCCGPLSIPQTLYATVTTAVFTTVVELHYTAIPADEPHWYGTTTVCGGLILSVNLSSVCSVQATVAEVPMYEITPSTKYVIFSHGEESFECNPFLYTGPDFMVGNVRGFDVSSCGISSASEFSPVSVSISE